MNALRRRHRLKRRYLDESPVCWYCGLDLWGGRLTTLDHIQPRSKGGSDDQANLVLACFGCNKRKADRDLQDVHVQIRRGAGLASQSPRLATGG